jgi:phage terminase large subunit-like protein
MVEFRQGYSTFNEPMKELDAMIVNGLPRHNGDPVLSWAIGNVVGKIGAYEDVMPKRESADAKIDPAVAVLMALARSMVHEEAAPPPPPRVYVFGDEESTE